MMACNQVSGDWKEKKAVLDDCTNVVLEFV